MKYVDVEWIGVTTPTQADKTIGFLNLTQQFGEQQMRALDALTVILRPRIVSVGSTRRLMQPSDLPGLSQSYMFGERPGTYVQRMTENDARVLFSCPCEYEFRNHDDPSHDQRVPIVPPDFMELPMIQSIILAASKHGKPTLSAPMYFDNPQQVLRQMEAQAEKGAEARERRQWEAARR